MEMIYIDSVMMRELSGDLWIPTTNYYGLQPQGRLTMTRIEYFVAE
jgi:hypothetical protein